MRIECWTNFFRKAVQLSAIIVSQISRLSGTGTAEKCKKKLFMSRKFLFSLMPSRTHSLFVSWPIKLVQINCFDTNGGHSLTAAVNDRGRFFRWKCRVNSSIINWFSFPEHRPATRFLSHRSRHENGKNPHSDLFRFLHNCTPYSCFLSRRF